MGHVLEVHQEQILLDYHHLRLHLLHLHLHRQDDKAKKLGIFSLQVESAPVKVDFPDGVYPNLVTGERVVVEKGTVQCIGRPIIISANL